MPKKGCRIEYIRITPGSPPPFTRQSGPSTRTRITAKQAERLVGSGYVRQVHGKPLKRVSGKAHLTWARREACASGHQVELGDRWGGAGRILVVPRKGDDHGQNAS